VKFANRRYAIRLKNLNVYDSGLYQCIVANDHGQLNWTVKLDVNGMTYFKHPIILLLDHFRHLPVCLY